MLTDRARWMRRILDLDPVTDHHEIYRISSGYEFPWDYRRAVGRRLTDLDPPKELADGMAEIM